MKIQFSLSALTLSVVICGCSANPSSPEQGIAAEAPLLTRVAYDADRETVLLVSLDDGTVVKQIIDIDADICFKQNSSTATTCLIEGAPIVDSATNTVIGIEMIEEHIDLVAK